MCFVFWELEHTWTIVASACDTRAILAPVLRGHTEHIVLDAKLRQKWAQGALERGIGKTRRTTYGTGLEPRFWLGIFGFCRLYLGYILIISMQQDPSHSGEETGCIIVFCWLKAKDDLGGHLG